MTKEYKSFNIIICYLILAQKAVLSVESVWVERRELWQRETCSRLAGIRPNRTTDLPGWSLDDNDIAPAGYYTAGIKVCQQSSNYRYCHY